MADDNNQIPAPPSGTTVQAQPQAQPAGGQIPPPPSGDIVMVQPASTESGQPEESTLGKIGDVAGDVSSGFGNALMDTVHGIGTLLNKVPGVGETLAPTEGLAAEKKGIQSPEGTAQWVGYGGENLAEFMLGDEALKGLSMADKFKQISGAMGLLEKSPRLMRAIQMGADVGKATGELGEEAKALIQKNPLLARLVGAGMDALRQGAVAGAQETAKTGSPEKGLKAGVEQGATSGVLGAAFGTLGRVAEKAGEAGKAVQEASEAGKNAPSALDIGQKVADQINDAETKMHGDFESGIQKLKGDLGDQKVPYQGSPLQKAAKATLEGITDKQIVPGKTEATGVLDEFGQPITKQGADTTVRTTKGALPEFGSLAGGSPESKNILTALADPKKTGDLTIDELIQRRQQLGEKIGVLTKGGTSSADRADVQVYQKLRDGIDDTIANLAKKSGKPEAAQDYDALRSAYKDKVKLFQSPAMQAMSAPGVASDVKLDNAAKYLLQGGNKLDKINTLTETIGEPAVKDLGKGILQSKLAEASAGGQINPAKFVKNFKQIDQLPPEVKEKLFDSGDAQKGLDKLSGDLKTAANYQKLIRAGIVLNPVSGMGLLLGSLASGDAEGARELLDKIANRPGMWSAFRTAGKIGATLEASSAARRVGTAAKGALGNVLQGATEPLSQPEDQDQQVVYTNQ
jgi:hypothetical protein